jgi:hypothetical protein
MACKRKGRGIAAGKTEEKIGRELERELKVEGGLVQAVVVEDRGEVRLD